MKDKIKEIIDRLALQQHPEGGYYRETYRSVGKIKPDSLNPDYSGARNYATSIYFLLTSGNFSAFHRIKQDEIWHFYDGSPIELHMISPEGIHSKHIIGRDFSLGEVPQLIVPGKSWFAAKVLKEDGFALVGCTVSPGFSFEDFEMGSRNDLIKSYPKLELVINQFTRE